MILRPLLRPLLRDPTRSPMLRRGGGLRPPSANMAAWYRKGQGITAPANAVSNWADQSGLGSRDLAQATGAAQPALQGDNTILFNGTSHFLKTAAFPLAQPCTIYLRMKQVSYTSFDYLFDGNAANSAYISQPGGSPSIAQNAGTADANSNSALAIGAWGSVASVFNGASSSLRVGATAVTGGNPGAGNPGGFTVASRGDGLTSWGNIQVAEIIIYNVAHSSGQQDTVIAYLNTL